MVVVVFVLGDGCRGVVVVRGDMVCWDMMLFVTFCFAWSERLGGKCVEQKMADGGCGTVLAKLVSSWVTAVLLVSDGTSERGKDRGREGLMEDTPGLNVLSLPWQAAWRNNKHVSRQGSSKRSNRTLAGVLMPLSVCGREACRHPT